MEWRNVSTYFFVYCLTHDMTTCSEHKSNDQWVAYWTTQLQGPPTDQQAHGQQPLHGRPDLLGWSYVCHLSIMLSFCSHNQHTTTTLKINFARVQCPPVLFSWPIVLATWLTYRVDHRMESYIDIVLTGRFSMNQSNQWYIRPPSCLAVSRLLQKLLPRVRFGCVTSYTW